MPVFLLKEYGQTPKNRPLNFGSGTTVSYQDYIIKADVLPIAVVIARRRHRTCRKPELMDTPETPMFSHLGTALERDPRDECNASPQGLLEFDVAKGKV